MFLLICVNFAECYINNQNVYCKLISKFSGHLTSRMYSSYTCIIIYLLLYEIVSISVTWNFEKKSFKIIVPLNLFDKSKS